jgi:hypothetical protein
VETAYDTNMSTLSFFVLLFFLFSFDSANYSHVARIHAVLHVGSGGEALGLIMCLDKPLKAYTTASERRLLFCLHTDCRK